MKRRNFLTGILGSAVALLCGRQKPLAAKAADIPVVVDTPRLVESESCGGATTYAYVFDEIRLDSIYIYWVHDS